MKVNFELKKVATYGSAFGVICALIWSLFFFDPAPFEAGFIPEESTATNTGSNTFSDRDELIEKLKGLEDVVDGLASEIEKIRLFLENEQRLSNERKESGKLPDEGK